MSDELNIGFCHSWWFGGDKTASLEERSDNEPKQSSSNTGSLSRKSSSRAMVPGSKSTPGAGRPSSKRTGKKVGFRPDDNNKRRYSKTLDLHTVKVMLTGGDEPPPPAAATTQSAGKDGDPPGATAAVTKSRARRSNIRKRGQVSESRSTTGNAKELRRTAPRRAVTRSKSTRPARRQEKPEPPPRVERSPSLTPISFCPPESKCYYCQPVITPPPPTPTRSTRSRKKVNNKGKGKGMSSRKAAKTPNTPKTSNSYSPDCPDNNYYF